MAPAVQGMNSFVGKYVALIHQTRVWMIGEYKIILWGGWGVSLGGERLDWLGAYWGTKKR